MHTNRECHHTPQQELCVCMFACMLLCVCEGGQPHKNRWYLTSLAICPLCHLLTSPAFPAVSVHCIPEQFQDQAHFKTRVPCPVLSVAMNMAMSQESNGEEADLWLQVKSLCQWLCQRVSTPNEKSYRPQGISLLSHYFFQCKVARQQTATSLPLGLPHRCCRGLASFPGALYPITMVSVYRG